MTALERVERRILRKLGKATFIYAEGYESPDGFSIATWLYYDIRELQRLSAKARNGKENKVRTK